MTAGLATFGKTQTEISTSRAVNMAGLGPLASMLPAPWGQRCWHGGISADSDDRSRQCTRRGQRYIRRPQPGMRPETLRNWVREAEVDRVHPARPTDDTKRRAELARNKREVKQANEVLHSAPLCGSGARSQN